MSRTQIRGSTRIKDATVTVAKLATEDGATWKIAGDNKGIIDGLGMPTTANQAANKAYVDNFVVQQSNNGIIYATTDPTISENPATKNVIWVNDSTGKIFVCVDNTQDNNVWEGYKPTIKIASTTTDVVDFFGDNSGVALYQFDGNPNDTGGVYNGVEQGNVEYTTGKFKQALLLNGSDAYIDLSSQMTGAYYSFSFWADWNRVNRWERIFDFGESNGSSWQTLVSRYNDTTQLCYKNGGDNIYSDNNYIINGELHHYAVVQDGGTVKFYRDGDLFSTTSTSETPQKHSRSYCYIGKSNWNDLLYKGKIDQLRIFNRTLTDDEINQLYNEQ